MNTLGKYTPTRYGDNIVCEIGDDFWFLVGFVELGPSEEFSDVVRRIVKDELSDVVLLAHELSTDWSLEEGLGTDCVCHFEMDKAGDDVFGPYQFRRFYGKDDQNFVAFLRSEDVIRFAKEEPGENKLLDPISESGIGNKFDIYIYSPNYVDIPLLRNLLKRISEIGCDGVGVFLVTKCDTFYGLEEHKEN